MRNRFWYVERYATNKCCGISYVCISMLKIAFVFRRCKGRKMFSAEYDVFSHVPYIVQPLAAFVQLSVQLCLFPALLSMLINCLTTLILLRISCGSWVSINSQLG